MFLIKTYRAVLNLLIKALNKAAEARHKEACSIERALKSLRNKQIAAQTDSAKLAVEAAKLKSMLG